MVNGVVPTGQVFVQVEHLEGCQPEALFLQAVEYSTAKPAADGVRLDYYQ